MLNLNLDAVVTRLAELLAVDEKEFRIEET